MRILNEKTGQIVGYLTDISTGGFRLDCPEAVNPNMDFLLRIELTPEIASKNFMVFSARSRWCRPDRFDPTSYNVGFQIIEMTPGDLEIFSRMFEKYGTQSSRSNNEKSDMDYLWR